MKRAGSPACSSSRRPSRISAISELVERQVRSWAFSSNNYHGWKVYAVCGVGVHNTLSVEIYIVLWTCASEKS